MKAIHMNDLTGIYKNLPDNELLLDVRTPEEYAEGHVPGAKNIDHEEVLNHLPELKKYSHIYIYCRSGKRAHIASTILIQSGIKDITLIKDSGMLNWSGPNCPIEKGN